MFKFKSSWYRSPSRTYPAQTIQSQQPGFLGTRADGQYVEWLALQRGWDTRKALEYCQAMDSRKLISQHVFAGEPFAAPKPKADPVASIVTKLKRLDWADLERIQAAIDARLLATELPKAA